MSVEWAAPAVVLEVRPHGEGGAVVTVLTEEHGRHAGLAKGGASRAQAGLWLPGNLIEAQFLSARNWPFGSALAMMVMAVMLVLLFVHVILSGRRNAAAATAR